MNDVGNDIHLQGLVNVYKEAMAEKITDIMGQQDPSTRNMTLFYEKLLNSNENNDNSNENDSEFRIFIESKCHNIISA